MSTAIFSHLKVISRTVDTPLDSFTPVTVDEVLLLNTFKTRLKSARRRIAGTGSRPDQEVTGQTVLFANVAT